MVVIDVGCGRYGDYYSLERLLDEFNPDIIYGFDPQPHGGLRDWLPAQTPDDSAIINIQRKAAWIADGEIGFREQGAGSWVTDSDDAPRVPSVDLARFIAGLPYSPIVLKLDCEGSEYDLLRHLMNTRTDKRLELAIVEWHDPDRGREFIESNIACRIDQWHW